MIYEIIIQDKAVEDAQDYAVYILSESGRVAALKWLDGLYDEIETLSQMPQRFKIIDENDSIEIELRQLLYFSHRVIYHINDESNSVHIIRVYHSARLLK
ncbi:MAG: type II toxin-antitoxin system RelE/ParE family toxin [Pseudomonadota bacterium]